MLANWLKQATYTVIFTGAGMSTESGLPDFRSNQGMWKEQDPSLVASKEALNKNIEQFFHFYRKRIFQLQDCQPHTGYKILAQWEKNGLIQQTITQNVDGFHTLAGMQQVAELHGTLQTVHCENCGRKKSSALYEKTYLCTCGGKLRPSVVLFGEYLPEKPFQSAALAADQADLFIVLGSSLSVSPANQLPMLAKRNGAKLVLINQESTAYDGLADCVIRQPIESYLQAVDAELSC